MPIYLYHCDQCGSTAEYLTNADKKPQSCAVCQGQSEGLERVLQGQTFGISSKGDAAETPDHCPLHGSSECQPYRLVRTVITIGFTEKDQAAPSASDKKVTWN